MPEGPFCQIRAHLHLRYIKYLKFSSPQKKNCTIESNCFLHVIQSKAQLVLIKLSDTYNVCCYGNSCAFGLYITFKTRYLISNAFVNTEWAYVGYLCSLCNCIHIKFTEAWSILEILLLAHSRET